jgi:hypothetical protein
MSSSRVFAPHPPQVHVATNNNIKQHSVISASLQNKHTDNQSLL